MAVLVVPAVAGCAHTAESNEPPVHSLHITGNHALSESTLRDQIETQATGWWPFAHPQRLDIAALDLDLKRLTAFYADRGYFDARVVRRKVEPRKDGSVDVTIVLDEGKPTHIMEIRFAAAEPADAAPAAPAANAPAAPAVPAAPSPTPPPPPIIDEKRWTGVAANNGVAPGRDADYAHYDATRNQIEGLLKEDGYAYAKVTGDMAVDRDRHQAVITYRLAPGPLVHLGKPIVEGQGRLPVAKILHRVSWTPGDKYTPDALATTQGRLYDLGVFSSVQMVLPPEPAPSPDVEMKLSPGKLRELKIGAGLGVDRDREEVRLAFEWSFMDFLGGLRKLRLRVKPAYAVIPSVTNIQRSGPVLAAEASLVQPDLAGTNATAQVTAGYDVTLTEGFAARGPRGTVGVERSFFRDRLVTGAAYNLQYFDFYDIDPAVFTPTATALGFGFQDPYRLAYLEEVVQADLRNRSVARRPGGFLGLRMEQGSPVFGGQFRYVAFVPEAKLFVPIVDRLVLAARAMTGLLHPQGGGDATDSPVTRRFRMGGPSSHRGFGFGRLSPQIADPAGNPVPVGGDAELLFSVEARVEVERVAGNWLSLVPFFDAGDVTPDWSGVSIARLHRAAGVAAEYTSPVGVIRVGAAARLNRLGGAVVPGQVLANPDPGQRFAFHFTIGEAF